MCLAQGPQRSDAGEVLIAFSYKGKDHAFITVSLYMTETIRIQLIIETEK